MQTPRPRVNPPGGPQIGWPCQGRDAYPCQRAPSDPTAPSSASTLQPHHPLLSFPVSRRGTGTREGFGSISPGMPCGRWLGGAGQGSPQAHAAVFCWEATQLGTSWGNIGTRHSTLWESNTDRDSLGGTRCSALQGSNTDGDITGEHGDTQQCFAGKQRGWGHPWGTHSDALPGSSRDRGILGTHRDTADKQVAPGAATPARDNTVATGREALRARDSHYCFTGPTSRRGARLGTWPLIWSSRDFLQGL